MVIDNWIYIYKSEIKKETLSLCDSDSCFSLVSLCVTPGARELYTERQLRLERRELKREGFLSLFLGFFFLLLLFSTARIGNQMKSHLVSLLYFCESDIENYCPLFISYNLLVWLIFSTFLISDVFLF